MELEITGLIGVVLEHRFHLVFDTGEIFVADRRFLEFPNFRDSWG